MENNKKEIKKLRLYTLRELCEAYEIEYDGNHPSRNLKKLMTYLEVEKQPRSNYYLVKEVKIKSTDLD